MASAHPTTQICVPELDHNNLSRLEKMYPDNLIWRWAGEPELVMENGDKIYASCIRPKEEGGCDDGGTKTTALVNKEDLLEVGDCCAFKFTSQEEQAVGLITRLCEKADSQGQLCSKRVTYKPFVKLDRLSGDVAEYTKSRLLDTIGNIKLPENRAIFLCPNEEESFLQDVIFLVAVHNVSLYLQLFAPKMASSCTGSFKAAPDHDKPSYCCLGLCNEEKSDVNLRFDEGFCLKDYLVPELTNAIPMVAIAEVEEDVME